MRRNPRDWQLSSGDLPDPRLAEAEPLLKEIEHNAVFRMIRFCKPLGILISNLSFLTFSGRGPRLLELPRERLMDLINSGVNPQTLALGLWGTRLPSEKFTRAERRFYVLLSFGMIALLVCMGWAWWPFCVPVILIMAYRCSVHRYMPYPVLPALSNFAFNEEMRASDMGTKAAIGCVTMFMVSWMLAVGLILLGIVAQLARSLYADPGYINAFLGRPSLAIPSFVFAAAVGFIVGNRRGKQCRSDRDLWLKVIRGHLASMIEKLLDEQDAGR